MALLLRDRVDGFAIGRILAPSYVGIFGLGAEIAALSTTELVEPLCRASFSGFSEVRRTAASAGDTYLRVTGTAAALTLPAGIGVALIARPLVYAAFGTRWLEAIPIVRILGCASTVAVFGTLAMVLLSTHGLLRQTFAVVVTGLVVRLGLLVALIGAMGLPGAAVAAACAMVLEQSLFTATAMRHFAMRPADLLARVWRPALATAVMAAASLAYAAASIPASNASIGALLAPIAIGSCSYAAALAAIWAACGRPEGAERDLLGLVRRLLSLVWALVISPGTIAAGRLR